MTPDERQLITELFERLVALESTPRDKDAERAIADGLSRAPNAIYPLVQSVLVQDEALKVANARIEELQAALGQPVAGQPAGGFLGTMRETLFGRHDAPRGGSVPSVRPGGSPFAAAPGYGAPAGYAAPPPGYAAPPPPPSSGFGGSFLGTAAAVAAGAIGGGLLLGGIRSMFGGHQQGPFAGTFDHLGSGGMMDDRSGRLMDDRTPWTSGPGSDDLARSAGIDDIGRNPAGSGNDDRGRSAGLFGNSQDDSGDGPDDSLDDVGDLDSSSE